MITQHALIVGKRPHGKSKTGWIANKNAAKLNPEGWELCDRRNGDIVMEADSSTQRSTRTLKSTEKKKLNNRKTENKT